MAETTPIDISKIKFGFIGLGNMGLPIVKNLIGSGHTMVLWDRSREKFEQFEGLGVTYALTPSDVVSNSDIIFCCVPDPTFVKDLVLGNSGILAEIKKGKSFVVMTTIDPYTSQDINAAVTEKQGRYMEAIIEGTITEAECGKLLIIAAGDIELFNDCRSVFDVIAKKCIHLGYIGSATKMKLILINIKATHIVGINEQIALAIRDGIPAETVMDMLRATGICTEFMLENRTALVDRNFIESPNLITLKNELSTTKKWCDIVGMPCPVAAAVNEVLKEEKRLAYKNL